MSELYAIAKAKASVGKINYKGKVLLDVGICKVGVYHCPINNTSRILGRKDEDDMEYNINVALTKELEYHEVSEVVHKLRSKIGNFYTLLFTNEKDAQKFGQAVHVVLESLRSGIPASLPSLPERLKMLHSSQDQSREKEEREANLIRQLRQTEEQRDNIQRELENCQEQLRGRDEQLERQNSHLREMEQQLTNFEGRIREKEEERANLERRLMLKDQELNELETTLLAAQQAAVSQQSRQETYDWVILRDEIHITNKLLGRGGWGSVNEGTYCGCTVAVKQIHDLILSPHNRRLFEREMNIASRCRHPCLLQFIGATNDEGSPLFVTELMERSLRALLEQRELSEGEVRVVSLDVAFALNYLHQKKPLPIIHRDISSANVLLWRQGNQWRGKVSDYGTANFMQQTMTVAPGAMIYSAPEALSSNQTTKVDVYSFGILLCEMCIRELPDPERREEQMAFVTNRRFRGLIRRCVQQNPAARPNMEQIIQELQQFNGVS